MICTINKIFSFPLKVLVNFYSYLKVTFLSHLDYLTDTIFDKLEAYERNRKAAQEMLSDGISEFKICKYMGINKNDLKMLLSNSHRNSRELSKES